MRKLFVLLLMMMSLLVSSSFTFAVEKINGDEIKAKVERMSDDEFVKLSELIKTYKKQNKKVKLTKKEVLHIAKKAGMGDLSNQIFTEKELDALYNVQKNSQVQESELLTLGGDLDVVNYDVFIMADSPIVFNIAMTMTNLDFSDVHDHYIGNADGFEELDAGTGVYRQNIHHNFDWKYIKPREIVMDSVYMGLRYQGSAAFYYVYMDCIDDGVPTTPYYKKHSNYVLESQ